MFRTLSVAALATFVLTLAGLSAQAQDDAKMKFEIYKGKKEDFRWRLKAANGAVLATGGQGYKAKADAKHGIASVQKAAGDAKANFECLRGQEEGTPLAAEGGQRADRRLCQRGLQGQGRRREGGRGGESGRTPRPRSSRSRASDEFGFWWRRHTCLLHHTVRQSATSDSCNPPFPVVKLLSRSLAHATS